ncbi:hypothetical protein HN682_08995 [Candidatus Peregrinibacteria bacterium]|jgi:hypothetical protein|nr:hypothetical protein [Candidatus Peregrinibacteria bacterium]
MTPEAWMEIGATGVVAVLLVMMFKYLTKDLSGELLKQYDIIIKLIDKINELKSTIDSKWKA